MPDLNVFPIVLSKRLYLYKTVESFFSTLFLGTLLLSDKADGKDKYGSTYFIYMFMAIAIDSRLSPAKVRWRQPAVSSELSLVTASLNIMMVYGQIKSIIK